MVNRGIKIVEYILLHDFCRLTENLQRTYVVKSEILFKISILSSAYLFVFYLAGVRLKTVNRALFGRWRCNRRTLGALESVGLL